MILDQLCRPSCRVMRSIPRLFNPYQIYQSLSRWSARRRMMATIRQFERDNPYKGDGVRPDPIPVEPSFDTFVEAFGGAKISSLLSDKSAKPLNADYLFAKDNVIAELKTLEGSFAGQNGVRLLCETLSQAGVATPSIDGLLLSRRAAAKGRLAPSPQALSSIR